MLYFLSPQRPPTQDCSAQSADRLQGPLTVKERHWPFRVSAEGASHDRRNEAASADPGSGADYVFVS